MQKNCRRCSASFEISPDDLAFYEQASPVIGRKKYDIPPPTLCPDCRFQRRLAIRNSSKLYTRKSDLSGKQIVSIYSPDKPYKVYDQDEWWSDSWDALTYGRPFDPSATLTEQLHTLSLVVPHPSLNTTNAENSYYTNHTLNCKNCYLIFGAGNDEDCQYGNYVSYSKDTIDALCVYHCERCYEGISSDHCHSCAYFMHCRNCTDCLLIEDCQSCSDCIACFGLQRKQYCFLNEEIGKEAMTQKRRELFPLTSQKISELRQQLDSLRAKLPHRYAHIYGSEDCTGDAIFNSKNCQNCFDITDCEDCAHVSFTPKGLHSHDCCFTSPEGVQWSYEACSTVGIRSAMATFMVWYGDAVYYSLHCHSCRDCFACVGLRNKRFCILNRQYAQEDYERTVGQIIEHMQRTGEWGEFLSPSLSAFCYNETIAQEYFPLTKEKGLAAGLRWKDDEDTAPSATRVISASQLPALITDIPDDILQWAIVCEVTQKPFKITSQELAFYRSAQLPIPHVHPDERHRLRMERRGSRTLWNRQCTKCEKSIQTTYARERPEIVYCEKCYLETVY